MRITIGSKLQLIYRTTKQKTIYIRHYLTTDQKREAIQDLGYAGLVLLDQYLFKASMNHSDFSDRVISKELGIPLKTVKYCRLKLIKQGYMYQNTFHSKDKQSIVLLAFGKQDVSQLTGKEDITLQDVLSRLFEQAEKCSGMGLDSPVSND
jgi:hypothetical protein